MAGLSWKAMVEAGQRDPALRARTDLFLRRVPEELHDLSVDPHCLVNLVPPGGGVPTNPTAAQALTNLRRSTARWMSAKADPLRSAYVAAFPTSV